MDVVERSGVDARLKSVGDFEQMTLRSAGGDDGISDGSGACSSSTTCCTIWASSGKGVGGRACCTTGYFGPPTGD